MATGRENDGSDMPRRDYFRLLEAFLHLFTPPTLYYQ